MKGNSHRPPDRTPNTSAAARWLLGVAFLTALGIVLLISSGGGAVTAAGLLTESPPPSPIETPSPLPDPAPQVREVSPNQGIEGTLTRINVYGRYFQQEARVFLVEEPFTPRGAANYDIPAQAIVLHTTRLSARHLIAKAPATLTPGKYALGVANPDGQTALSREAFTVIASTPSTDTDLSALSQNLWTTPHTLFRDEAASIGLTVRRVGGVGGTQPFFVDFYQDEINAAHKIGRAMVPPMNPDSTASSSPVAWTPETHGEVTLIAVIDPTEQVSETNEENNVVRRTVTVRFHQAQDVTPPVARSLNVETARTIVNSRNLRLSVDAFDPEPNPTGVNRNYYVEMQWFSGVNNGTGAWLPVQWSEWMSHEDQPHDFELLPNSGLRYLMAWVADGAGNISSKPAVHRVNYVPATDSLGAGEVRVYRQPVVAGQCLRVRTVPDGPAMDPDIYVWGPSWTSGNPPTGYSIAAAGETDEVVIQPTEAGVYQIEIVALTDASFGLEIQVTGSCARSGAASPRSVAEKQVRTEPSIPLDTEPEGAEAAPESIPETLVFLPQAFQDYLLNAQGNGIIFLPVLQR